MPEGYPAIASHEVVIALIEAAEKLGYPYHVGLTVTASGFYGAQGRKIPGFPLRHPNLVEDLAKLNILNFEMESSTLFTLANVRGLEQALSVQFMQIDLRTNSLNLRKKRKLRKTA